MDSIIPLGQKNTLAEYMILSDADNRPPMLDKDFPLIWPTIEENGVNITKKYVELSAAEKIQVDYDLKATNIILQGDDPIACLNKEIAFLTVVASLSTGYKSNAPNSEAKNASGQARVVKCYNCQDPGVLDGQVVQTIISNNNAFQTEDLDTYDSGCDDISNAKAALMSNISNYGSNVISEVPHSETYLNDMENQDVHAMHDFE
nr:hypothetical protein [Tanacetum cinerariifolium]